MSNKETLIKDAATKTSLVDADTVPLSDSAASSVTKKITWANVKSVLKDYFDALYNKVAVNNTLTSTSTTDALSAAQGKALNDSVTTKPTKIAVPLASGFSANGECHLWKNLNGTVSINLSCKSTINITEDITLATLPPTHRPSTKISLCGYVVLSSDYSSNIAGIDINTDGTIKLYRSGGFSSPAANISFSNTFISA